MKKLISFIKNHLIDAPIATASYIKNRLTEPSTWMAISGGVTAAAALTAPWSYVSIGIAVMIAILPTSAKKPG